VHDHIFFMIMTNNKTTIIIVKLNIYFNFIVSNFYLFCS